ncbi:hypothetical protein ACOSZF_15025 [Cytobacillus firmus]|uniref:Uncharacterized protein n=1 Tax=Cytobacillus firmus TaxID=1399 RepID=A0A7Y5B146_CYTFI|nr:hypothetical protein [Cytobacillus firmus]KAF0822013.1 hypothetical protein KIS1582_4212 [Cytobacillus firmus]MBG9655185.1 hypothetical protein [Cytobacillus firmus]MED1907166.1 hypothetical protein [Cytobacillus firmus]NUH85666.1 hypothetical protein [Cytobacillus firmus]
MKLLDAKIIHTKYGIETYMDLVKNVEARDIHFPSEPALYYEITVGVEYLRLRKEKYYDSEKNYFKIRMNLNMDSITLSETKTESLFAVKDKCEREATKELVGEWLIQTNAFRQAIQKLIDEKKVENVQTEEDIKKVLGTIRFLERILEIKPEDVLSAKFDRKLEVCC